MIDISTYLNRITSQHKTKPNYIDLVEARLQPLIDLAECLYSFDAAFDLETAVGVQLDIIGQFVGLSRLLTFQPGNGLSPILDDDMFRILLKAKISKNNWNGTATGMYELWSNLFPEYTLLIRDNQDMTMTVYTDMSTPFLLAQLIQYEYIVPKPMGVRFTYIFLEKYQYEVDDYYSGVACDWLRSYFIDDEIPIVTDADDYYAVALSELFRLVFIEETDIITDANDFYGAATRDYFREIFVEETGMVTDGTDYDAVAVLEAIRELHVAAGDDIVTDTTDYNAVGVMTVFREYSLEQEAIVTTATIYNGGINHERFKEAFTE
jgi:hypothetical protein